MLTAHYSTFPPFDCYYSPERSIYFWKSAKFEIIVVQVSTLATKKPIMSYLNEIVSLLRLNITSVFTKIV
jgi:hypothetical protein